MLKMRTSCFLFLYVCFEYVPGTLLVHEPLVVHKIGGVYSPPALEAKICPPQTKEELLFHRHNKELNCNFSLEITNPELKKCSEEVKPVLQFENDLDELKCYSYAYNICSIKYKTVGEPEMPSDMEMDPMPDDDEGEPEGPDEESEDDETYAANLMDLATRQTLKLFSFCAKENDGVKDTIYTTHSISSHGQSGMQDVVLTEFPRIENQEAAQQKIFNKKEINEQDDYLTPQMLVSALDIPQDFAKEVNNSNANFQPQWASLSLTWTMINFFVWKAEKTQMRNFKHITGATGMTKIDGTPLHLGKDLKKRIPVYWWRLINVNKNENILIVMHNVPEGEHSITTTKVCPENVCDKFGWFGITQIARQAQNHWTYCCKVDQKVLETLQLPSDLVELGGTATLYYAADSLKYMNEILSVEDYV